jgi:hypothetical protein
MKNHLLAVSLLGLVSFLSLPQVSGQVPVRVRMTAAQFGYFNNPDPNGGSLISSQVGFDMVWNLQRFDSYLNGVYTTQKLAGSGSITYTPASGAAGSVGNFTLNPARNPYLEIASQTDGVITLKIGGPHNQGGNAAMDSLISDRTPGLPFITQIPYPGVFLAGGNVLKASSSWSPAAQLLPRESDRDYAEQTRAGYAVVRFSTKSLPQVLPFKFVYDGNRDGTVSRIVFFGRVEVSEDGPNVPLSPTNALTLGGYSPPTDGSPPANPPDDLTPPGPADFSKWFRDIFPTFSESIQSAVTKLRSAPVERTSATSARIISTRLPKAAPFAGSVSIAVVVKPAGTKTTPRFPAKSTANNVVIGTKSLRVFLDPTTRKTLKTGKACTVFILAKSTPKGGKPVVLSKRFSLKATKS